VARAVQPGSRPNAASSSSLLTRRSGRNVPNPAMRTARNPFVLSISHLPPDAATFSRGRLAIADFDVDVRSDDALLLQSGHDRGSHVARNVRGVGAAADRDPDAQMRRAL